FLLMPLLRSVLPANCCPPRSAWVASLAEGGNTGMPVFEGAQQTEEPIQIAASDCSDLLHLLRLVLQHAQHLKKREQPAHPMRPPGCPVHIQTVHRIPRSVVAPPRHMIRRVF